MILRSIALLSAVLVVLISSLSVGGSAHASADEGDGSFSALMATDLVVPNAGYFFVVDFDTHERQQPLPAPAVRPCRPMFPRNGFFVSTSTAATTTGSSRRAVTCAGVETLRPLK